MAHILSPYSLVQRFWKWKTIWNEISSQKEWRNCFTSCGTWRSGYFKILSMVFPSNSHFFLLYSSFGYYSSVIFFMRKGKYERERRVSHWIFERKWRIEIYKKGFFVFCLLISNFSPVFIASKKIFCRIFSIYPPFLLFPTNPPPFSLSIYLFLD